MSDIEKLQYLSVAEQLIKFKSAGTIDTDEGEYWDESTYEFKKGNIVFNCPHCDTRRKPLLSKTTTALKNGSYYPGHSCVTGSICFYTIYKTYCRKCKKHFLFTLQNES